MPSRRRPWLLALLALALAPLICWLVARRLAVADDVLTGVVTADGHPIPGARVRAQTTGHFTDADEYGRFRLPRSVCPKGGRLTAWKDGYFVGGTSLDASPLALTLTLLPANDDEAYEWVDPAPQRGGLHNCAHCHGEIYREWTSSAHSRSASGERFRNLYDGTDRDGKPEATWSLLDQKPDGAGVCSSCHAPAITPGDPARFDLRELKGVAAKGVHCDYCHKISSVASEEKLGLAHGNFNLNLLRPATGKDGGEVRQLFFGPLDDADRGDDAFSPLYKQSVYCASCHEGVVFGVPVYTTYSEWRASPAGRAGTQCQGCHMKPTGEMTNFAPGAGGRERDPHTLGNHRFFDGSQEAMLKRSVRATATLRAEGDAVRAAVTVTASGVGHRVPTGFIDRHLVLVVEGQTARGEVRAPSEGPRLPDFAGEPFAGRGGKVYAKLLHSDDGHSPAPFWHADPAPVDSRLSPEKPDETAFVFPADVVRLRVRVVYRRFWPETAARKKWPDAGEIDILDESCNR
jgi:hypothetical protein